MANARGKQFWFWVWVLVFAGVILVIANSAAGMILDNLKKE